MAAPIISAGKTCSYCGNYLALEHFGKLAKNKEGLRAYCKSCSKSRASAWKAANKQRVKEKMDDWRKKNADRIAATTAAWIAANSEKLKQQYAARYAADPDKAKAAAKAWFEANKERRNETRAAYKKANPAANREYYLANRERIAAANTLWRKENPEARRIIDQNRRARLAGNGGRLSTNLAVKLMALQKGKCACCKIDIQNAKYHLDHIQPVSKGGRNEDANIQILCARCNLAKFNKLPEDFMRERGFLL